MFKRRVSGGFVCLVVFVGKFFRWLFLFYLRIYAVVMVFVLCLCDFIVWIYLCRELRIFTFKGRKMVKTYFLDRYLGN